MQKVIITVFAQIAVLQAFISTGNDYPVLLITMPAGIDDALSPRYTNHTYDDTLGMYHAQYRFLDAENRGFTQVDPVKDSLNWYGYCGGNPVVNIDPLGLVISLQAETEEKANELLGHLQQLTDDVITMAPTGGSNGTMYSIDVKHGNGTHPLGTSLIREIHESDMQILIQYEMPPKDRNMWDSGGSYARPWSWDEAQSTGCGSLIGFLPSEDAKSGGPFTKQPDGTNAKVPFPSIIVLGHELIHAYHNMTGTANHVGSSFGFSAVKKDDGHHYGYLAPIEELRTVGLNYFELLQCKTNGHTMGTYSNKFSFDDLSNFHMSKNEEKYTENKLREEHGFPTRMEYLTYYEVYNDKPSEPSLWDSIAEWFQNLL